jgi:hypothetical protein
MKNALTQRLGNISKWNVGEAFGVPHTFTPSLSIAEALFAVVIALGRIFVGSLNFALWGVAAWIIFDSIHNPILRVVALLPIALLFVGSMAALMIGISSLVNWVHRKHPAVAST